MTLQIRISSGSSTPIYKQIMEQICRSILNGSLARDDQLPSIRTLAEKLVVNANTVAKAYGELVREGIIEPRQGRGYFVSRRRRIFSDEERRRRLEKAVDEVIGQALVLNFSREEIHAALDRKLDEMASDQPKGESVDE